MNIAITGTAGFLGSTLLRALEKKRFVKTLLALDKQPPPFSLKKGRWIPIDLTETGVDQKLLHVFTKHPVDILVHAALLNKPLTDLEYVHELQSVGTMLLLTAVQATSIRKLILASTTDVYGAFPDNPNFLTENHPPRGRDLSPFLNDKAEVEEQFLSFQKKNPDRVVTVLRPATILGPTVNNFKTHFLQNPLIPTVLGFDPLVQFVHETDVLRAFLITLREEHRGIFNIVARGVLPLGRAIRVLGKLPIPIPYFLLYPSAEFLWYCNVGEVPGAHINFLKYLCIADGTKAWRGMHFEPVYTSTEALWSFNGRELKKEMIALKLEEMENRP